ncbi:MAG: ATP-binding cassette domain-containing protein [Calditrichaeota bacterium]|nr:ATP-binding cassette domain-containing protein [Calditrichota bacterium]
MLQISNLTYAIGERLLLDHINLSVHPGQRIGLVGPNGTGKTTLLRILAGELRPLSGGIIKPRNYGIGYLPQENLAFDKGTLLGAVLESKAEIQQIELEIHKIQHQLSSGQENNSALLNRLGHLQDRFAMLGGYEMESEAKKILTGLGFKESDFFRPLKDFSGGWRMRAYLAKILLIKPDLLLLDEPTNHLDLPSLEWIENFLRTFTGSMIIVSHDRFFLDRLAQHIAELYRGTLKLYSGNYRFYEEEKAKEEELIVKKWEEQQAEIERIQRFIDRFRYKATKAAQVQSRIKRLEKLQRIELPDAKKSMRFKIKANVFSYKDVLQIKDLSFRYSESQDWVLKDIDLKLYRGEKVALVGPNGAGKTTLTRLICGELTPVNGTVKLGEHVKTGYYAQHQIDSLNFENTMFEEVSAHAAPEFRTRVRDILGVFGFGGDTVEKPISVLSGGEKARVSLAKILLSPANFLIMDEPTNHLDLNSKEALEYALCDYDGTLLIISHDRYFLDKLVHRVLELKDGALHLYEGNYSDYLRFKELRSAGERQALKEASVGEKNQPKSNAKKSKEQKRLEAQARQAISKQRNSLQKEIGQLELKIEQGDERKKQLEDLLARPETYQNSEEVVSLKKEYDRLTEDLRQWETRWEEANLELEELLKKLEAMANG